MGEVAGEVSSTAAHNQNREAGASPEVCSRSGRISSQTCVQTLWPPAPPAGQVSWPLRAYTVPTPSTECGCSEHPLHLGRVALKWKVEHTMSGEWPISTE